MSSCCDSEKKEAAGQVEAAGSCHTSAAAPAAEARTAGGSCCGPAASAPADSCHSGASAATSSCCPDDDKRSFDWLLWGSGSLVLVGYLLHLSGVDTSLPGWAHTMSHGVFELLNTMWWGVLLAALFVGLLGRIPQSMVTAVLGQGGSVMGVLRATMAGVLLDLCSHGILMVGMQLYNRGASAGQVMAFLLASPWNSLSLTLILVALIGLPWTLAFIALSMLVAVITGVLFDLLVKRGTLPANPHSHDLPEDYHLGRELKAYLADVRWTPATLLEVCWDGIKGSRMVLRWLLFGVLLATALRGFLSLEDFQTWFGPSLLGLLVTLVAATIIEVCSEGSTPIAADLVTRAGAPGNGFAFLMTGVSTDYTEVMVLKDTTRSWKLALFLPLLTVPQVVVIALILNGL
ncbi:permease [Pseudomaricurvus sp. HS19]|uniref:permease n=1 Tax=Pseudomaricurvus sp. HS19 TaxID=2692626 RepID=UPI0013697CE9|nr:permease [Pseudomaricurvus sp. HS19]MYM62899.1 ATPase [Pseudomaricurvus sp. HS19]